MRGKRNAGLTAAQATALSGILNGTYLATPIGVPVKWPYRAEDRPSNTLLLNGQTVGDTGSGATLEGEDYRTIFDLAKHHGENLGTEDFDSGDIVAVPDFRGRVSAGIDNMGGTSANRITNASADSLGGTMGAETHILIIDEMPAHTHPVDARKDVTVGGASYAQQDGGSEGAIGKTKSTGEGYAHNNVQPTLFENVIARYK